MTDWDKIIEEIKKSVSKRPSWMKNISRHKSDLPEPPEEDTEKAKKDTRRMKRAIELASNSDIRFP